ncbi:hypothetical protein GCM10023205_60640 [Yinghuangia aomiensis]|uniref:PH domain-containing protein n=1 Tax=Yinghuangia aomiensis TaxID=676205 RepID=A0ABP9I0C8_9ACTN
MKDVVGVYEVRFGWTPWLAVCAGVPAALIAGAFSPTVPLGLAVGVWVVCGAVLAVVAVGAGRRAVAFRADAAGVFLGTGPFAHRGSGTLVPWSDVAGLVLWEWEHRGRHRMLGVVTPQGPRDLLMHRSARVRQINRDLAGPLANASIGLTGLRIDMHRLAAALAHVAPHASLNDTTTQPPTVIRPGGPGLV